MASLFADDLYDDQADPEGGNFPQESFVGDRSGDKVDLPLLGLGTITAQWVKLFNENKLPHGILVAGPTGTGKATLARQLAHSVISFGDKMGDNEPDLFGGPPSNAIKLHDLRVPAAHPDVIKINNGSHPDFLLLQSEILGETGRMEPRTITVDEVRKVGTFLHLTASKPGGWRVVIIDGAQAMNRAAQNALLKILEEPPQRTCLILTTTHVGALLPTIRSRVQLYHTTGVQPDDLTRIMTAHGFHPTDIEKKWLNALAGGAPGQALRLLQLDSMGLIQDFFALWDTWPKVDESAWVSFTEKYAGTGTRDDLYVFLSELWLWWVRALTEAKVNPSKQATLHQLAKSVPVDKMVDHFSLTRWLEIEEGTRSLWSKTLGLHLERRQAIYSARLLLTENF